MSIRPKTKRRLLYIAAVLSVVALGGLALWFRAQWAAEKENAILRAQAMEAYATGDMEGALPLLSKYLAKSKTDRLPPETADAEAVLAYGRCRLALPMAGNRHLQESKYIFETYLRLRPADQDARRTLLEIYAQANHVDETIRVANELLAAIPDDRQALAARAVAYSQTRSKPDYPKALADAARLNEVHPLDLRGQLLTQQLMLASGTKPAAVIERAEALTRRHPQQPAYKLLLGLTLARLAHEQSELSLQQRSDRLQQGLDVLLPALPDAAADPALALTAAAALDEVKLFSASLSLLRDASRSNDDARIRALLARRLWQNGQLDAAVEMTAAAGTAASSAEPDALGYRVMSLMQLGGAERRAEANRTIDRLAARTQHAGAVAWARTLRARFGGVDAPAPPKPTTTAPTTRPQPAPVLVAAPALAPKDLIREYQAAREKDAANPVICFLLGEAYAQLGEATNAVQWYRAAADRAVDWGLPHALIAEQLLQTGDVPLAVRHADYARERSPLMPKVQVVNAVARFQSLPRDANDAALALLSQVRRLQELTPNEPTTLPILVALLVRTGQRDGAIERIESLLSSEEPLPPATLAALIEVSRYEGLGMEGRLTEQLLRSEDGAPSLRMARLRATQAFNAGRRAEGLAGLLADQKAASAQDDPHWRVTIAAYREMLGDPAALAGWVAVGDAHPRDRVVQTAVLRADSRVRDRSFWKRTIDRVRALTGDEGHLWRIETCRWQLTSGVEEERSKAVATLLEMTRQTPAQVEVRRVLAAALEQDGKLREAIDHLTVVTRLRPDDADAALALIRVLRANGQTDEARARLDRLAQRDSISPADRRLVAAAYERQGVAQRAIDVLLAGGMEQPDAQRDVMLAQLHRLRGDAAKAEAAYLRLLDGGAATDSAALVEGAIYFSSHGKTPQAQSLMARLERMPLKPGELQLCRASFTEARNPAEAVKAYEAAAAAAPASPAAWRGLAAVHLRRQRLDDAADAVGRGLAAVPPGEESLIALWSQIDLLRKVPTPVQSRMIAVVSREPGSPAATELLKVLATPSADPAADVQRLTALVAAHPSFLPAYEMAIDRRIARGEHAQASQLADEMLRAFPYDPGVAGLAVRVHRATGQYARMLAATDEWRGRLHDADKLEPDLYAAEAQMALDRPLLAVRLLDGYVRTRVAATQPATQTATRPTAIAVQDAELFTLYGRAMFAANQAADAATRLRPLLARGAAGRAIWLRLARDHRSADAAGAWIQQAVAAISPMPSAADRLQLARAWYNAGMIHGDTPCHNNAKSLAESLVDDPKVGDEAQSLLASTAQELADHDKAVSIWRSLLQKSTAAGAPNAAYQNNLAYALLLRGTPADLEEARPLAEQAAAANPDAVVFRDTLARILSRLGQTEQAIQTFEAALAKAPDDLDLMIGMAELLSRSNDAAARARAADLVAKVNRALPKSPPLSAPVRKQLQGLQTARTPPE